MTNFLSTRSAVTIRRVVAILSGAALLVAALFYRQQQEAPLKVSGFIEADEIRVGSRVGGRVHRVEVDEGDRVSRGDLLIELEPFDLRERLAETEALVAERRQRLEKLQAGFRAEERGQAEARYDQLAAQLKKLKNGPRPQQLAAARAQVDLAEANVKYARVQQDRLARLVPDGAAPQEALDEANEGLAVAQAQLRVAREDRALLEAGTRSEEIEQAEAEVREAEQAWLLKKNGYRSEEIAEAQAAVEAAAATRRAIQQQIEELKVVAPSQAVVESVELEPGDLVAANTPALALTVTEPLWVRAYVPEDQLGVQIGQQVAITVDSYPEKSFTGRITFIARQGEFTPSNVQTPEERSKQVFRIKVTLIDGIDLLRPGMAADVWLDSGSFAE